MSIHLLTANTVLETESMDKRAVRVAVFAALLLLTTAPPAQAQQDYEAADNSADQVDWLNVDWQDPFNTDETLNLVGTNPGSLVNGSGGTTLDDNVTIGYHATGTHDYRINSDIGQIGNLNIGSANNTSAGSTQLQVRLGGGIVVGGTTTLGAGSSQGSINANNSQANVVLLGDVNAGGTNATHFIQQNNNNASSYLVIGGDINGFETIDLRINRSADVFYNTTGGTTASDTVTQTLQLDNFDIANTANNGQVVNHTVGPGKIINADDVEVSRNTSSSTSANTLEATLNLDGATVTTDANLRVGSTSNNSNSDADARLSTGVINIGVTGSGQGANTDVDIGNSIVAGSISSPASAGSGVFGDGTININDGADLFVNNNIELGETNQSRGTLNVIDGTVLVGNAVQVGGDAVTGADLTSEGVVNVSANGTLTTNGNLNVGRDGIGTVTVDAGVINVDGDIRFGDSTTASNLNNTLTIQNGGTVNATGDNSDLFAGLTAGNSGTINVNDGTLAVDGNVFLGGNATNGDDNGTTGTLNVGANGTVDIGHDAGGQRNLDVGRDGTGFLNTVAGSTINLGRGNLVIGQTTSNAADANDARGTVVFNGGDINIGDSTFETDTLNDDSHNSDLNFNRGGGDISHRNGATVNIENNLNWQETLADGDASASNVVTSSYTIDSGSLEIGNNFNAADPNLATGAENRFKIEGDLATITVGNNLNGANSTFNLEFDFQGGNTISHIDVLGAQANVSDAVLTLSNIGGLATYSGDIVLVDTNDTDNGTFAGLSEGARIAGTDYQLTYIYTGAGATGTSSIALVQAVPEPSSIALLAIGGLVVGMRRRRRS